MARSRGLEPMARALPTELEWVAAEAGSHR
jgi:hypothetical protein